LGSFFSIDEVLHSTKSSLKMSFTITRSLELLPSYSTLYKLAEENQVRVIGNEHAGLFSGRGVEGDYQFSEGGVQGKFSGHGVTGEFSFAIGNSTVTVIEKPFWLPESLLKRKIAEGLEELSRNDSLRDR
jgi:hypothetical protein